jgi:1,4-alpha-glucan branching enzyme
MANLPANPQTVPMGATLVPGGANFRAWAPRATEVRVIGDFNKWTVTDPAGLLQSVGDETWAGFIPGITDNSPYLFHVVGPAGPGYKRDPRARALTLKPAFPQCNCLVRNPASFPWHNTGWRTPPFNDLILYQLHVGTFHIGNGNADGKFLDVALQIPYLASLGVNALQLMPIVEFATTFSKGYNGLDFYSPENQYGVDDPGQLQNYFAQINNLLTQRGQPGYANISAITGCDNQLRALVDLAHVWGIGILFDVVYNHAGGGWDNNCLEFFDLMPEDNMNKSLYFTDQGWAGGLVFAYWNQSVRQFLIDNTVFFYEEYRIDGFRFDEISVADAHGGWQMLQDCTGTARYSQPAGILIAEYWPLNRAVVTPTSYGGAGFDASWEDKLRDAVRGAIGQASAGSGAAVDLDIVAGAIQSFDLPNQWRAVNCVENHDLVKAGADYRIARLADQNNARSWYARSRSRVATGLLLTAPGIPMLFMGQEILEDKQWSDNPGDGLTPYWAGLQNGDTAMVNHLRFTSELISLRRRHPALRGEMVHAYYVHNQNRVIAFHRWLDGIGRDVVVVASLNESTWWSYELGFPGGGRWLEVFNSDIYDNWVNPQVAGNGGQIFADGGPMDGMPNSAAIVIPANGVVVFARDSGD